IDQAITNRHVRRVLPGLVSLVHQAGGLALLEGIETEQQAMIALQADIDFVQGYYFARPAESLLPDPYHPDIGQLFTVLRQDTAREELSSRELFAPYKDVFFTVVMDVLDG